MFKQSGQFKGKITEVVFAPSKFKKDDDTAFDLCLKIEATIGGSVQSDYWRGEISNSYGQGNLSNKKQSEITIENLQKIGFEGEDLSTAPAQLTGKETEFTVEDRVYNGKTYYDVKYLNGNYSPEKLSSIEVQKRLQALGMNPGNATAQGEQSATDDSSDW